MDICYILLRFVTLLAPGYQAHADQAHGWCSWWQLCFQRGVPVLQVENPALRTRDWTGPSQLRHQPISSDDANYHGCLELGTAWNCLELFGPCDSNSFWFWSAVNKTNQQDTVLTETYLAKFCRPDMLNGRKRSTVSRKQSLQVTSSSV